MRSPLPLPERLFGFEEQETILLPEPMGSWPAAIWLREEAKSIASYHLAIESGISGVTDEGEEIPINSVGRWLFGTPGYKGHIRVDNQAGREVKLAWPAQAPSVVRRLIAELKAKVEGSAARPD